MNKKIAFMSIAIATAMPIASVFAADATTTDTASADTTPTTTQRQQNRETMMQNRQLRQQNQAEKQQNQDQKQQNIQDRCANIESKVGERISKFQTNKTNFANAFQNIQDRLSRLIDRLSTQNVDLTKLKTDIATLNTKIDQAKIDQDAFVSALGDVQTAAPTACGTSKGEFMGKLGGARTLALTAQKDRLDVKNFFETTIKPDLMAIRKQLEAQKTTTTTPEQAQ